MASEREAEFTAGRGPALLSDRKAAVIMAAATIAEPLTPRRIRYRVQARSLRVPLARSATEVPSAAPWAAAAVTVAASSPGAASTDLVERTPAITAAESGTSRRVKKRRNRSRARLTRI